MQHTTCTEEHPICSGGYSRNHDDEWSRVEYCPFIEVYMMIPLQTLWAELPPLCLFNICPDLNRCN